MSPRRWCRWSCTGRAAGTRRSLARGRRGRRGSRLLLELLQRLPRGGREGVVRSELEERRVRRDRVGLVVRGLRDLGQAVLVRGVLRVERDELLVDDDRLGL